MQVFTSNGINSYQPIYMRTEMAYRRGKPLSQGANAPQKKQHTAHGSIPTVRAADRPVRRLGVDFRLYSSETRHLPRILPRSGTKATEITAPLLHFGRPIKKYVQRAVPPSEPLFLFIVLRWYTCTSPLLFVSLWCNRPAFSAFFQTFTVYH
jgi:hypothetical protein